MFLFRFPVGRVFDPPRVPSPTGLSRKGRWGAVSWGCAAFLLSVSVLSWPLLAADEARPPDEPPEAPDPQVVALLSAPGAMQEAKRTFSVYCTECHGLAAWGGMGPNLTDVQTLYGGRYQDIVNIITNGSPNRPMPAWGRKLPFERIRLVAALVYSLRGRGLPALPNTPPWQTEPSPE